MAAPMPDSGHAGRRFHDARGPHDRSRLSGRGVLLDIPATLGPDACEAATRSRARIWPRQPSGRAPSAATGDVVLIRSGWGRASMRAPSPTWAWRPASRASARRAPAGWPDRGIHARGRGHHGLRAARPPAKATRCCRRTAILLVEAGIYIIEALTLEDLASAGAYEFTFMLCSAQR